LRALCCEDTILSAQAMRNKVNRMFILITSVFHRGGTPYGHFAML